MADATPGSAHSDDVFDDRHLQVLNMKLEQQKQTYEARHNRLKVQLAEKDFEIQRLQSLVGERLETKEGMQSHVDSLTVTTEILTRQLGLLTGLLRALDPTKALEKVVDRYMNRVKESVEKGESFQRAEDFLADIGKANEKLQETKKGQSPILPPAELFVATKFVPVLQGQPVAGLRSGSPPDAPSSWKAAAGNNPAELKAERRKSKAGLKFQARKSILVASVTPFAPPAVGQGQNHFAASLSNPSLPNAQTARERDSTTLVSPPTSRRQSLAAAATTGIGNQSGRNLALPPAQGGLCKGRSMRRDQFAIWLNQHGVSSGGEEGPQTLDNSHNGTTVFPEVSMRSVQESQESDEVDTSRSREGLPAKGSPTKQHPPSFRTLAKKRGTVYRNLNMDGLIDANVFTEVKAAKAKANQLRVAFTRELEEKEAEVGELKAELSVVKEELKVTKESETKLKLQCERLITERLTRSPQSVSRKQHEGNPAPLATFAFVPSDLEGSGRRDPPSITASGECHSPSSSTRCKGTAEGDVGGGPRPLSPSQHERPLKLPTAVDALSPNQASQSTPSKRENPPPIIPSIPLLPAIGGSVQRKQSPSSTPKTRPQRATVQASPNTAHSQNEPKYSPITVQYGKTAVGFRLLLSCYVQDVCNLLRSCQPVQDKLFHESVKMQDFMLDRWNGKNIHLDEPPGSAAAATASPAAATDSTTQLNHLLNLNLEEVIPSFVHNVMADQLLKEAPEVDKWEDELELLKQTWISLTRSLQQFVAHFQQQMGQWRKAQVADFAAHKSGHVVPKLKRPPAQPSVGVQTMDGSLRDKEPASSSPKKSSHQKQHHLRSPKKPTTAKKDGAPPSPSLEDSGIGAGRKQDEDEDGKVEVDTTGL